MLNIRTDRLANWLLYLAVLLGVIGTNAHAETTQLGALRQEIVAATEPSLAEMQCAIRPDLEPRLPFNQRALIANAESRVDNSCPWARRYCITSSAVTHLHTRSEVANRPVLCLELATSSTRVYTQVCRAADEAPSGKDR